MKTQSIPGEIDDMKQVTEAILAGRPVDPILARRVQDRAARVRRQTVEKHGVQDIGVTIIREAREERH